MRSWEPGELPVQLDHDSIRALVGAGGGDDAVDDAVRAGALPVGGALAVGTGSFGAQALPPLAYEVEVLVLPQCRRDGMQHLFDQCGLGCQAAGERVDAVAGQSVACRAPAGRTQDFRCRARGPVAGLDGGESGGGQGTYDGGEQRGVVGGQGGVGDADFDGGQVVGGADVPVQAAAIDERLSLERSVAEVVEVRG